MVSQLPHSAHTSTPTSKYPVLAGTFALATCKDDFAWMKDIKSAVRESYTKLMRRAYDKHAV